MSDVILLSVSGMSYAQRQSVDTSQTPEYRLTKSTGAGDSTVLQTRRWHPMSLAGHTNSASTGSRYASFIGIREQARLLLESQRTIRHVRTRYAERDTGVHSFAPFYLELETMTALLDGWDTYEAPAPSLFAREAARGVLDQLLAKNVTPNKILPSAEGGIAISFKGSGRKYADIECFNSGEILAVTTDRQQEPRVWQIDSEHTVGDTIDRISDFLR